MYGFCTFCAHANKVINQRAKAATSSAVRYIITYLQVLEQKPLNLHTFYSVALTSKNNE